MSPPDDGEDGLAGHAMRGGFVGDPRWRLGSLKLERIGVCPLDTQRQVIMVILDLMSYRDWSSRRRRSAIRRVLAQAGRRRLVQRVRLRRTLVHLLRTASRFNIMPKEFKEVKLSYVLSIETRQTNRWWLNHHRQAIHPASASEKARCWARNFSLLL